MFGAQQPRARIKLFSEIRVLAAMRKLRVLRAPPKYEIICIRICALRAPVWTRDAEKNHPKLKLVS
jgi:hypothetical protein